MESEELQDRILLIRKLGGLVGGKMGRRIEKERYRREMGKGWSHRERGGRDRGRRELRGDRIELERKEKVGG
jgi:hypothetical protein